MTAPLALGVDPGLAHFGYALCELRPDGILPVSMGVIRTVKSDKKQRVRAADDNVRRAQEVAEALHPLMVRCSVVCAEAMSHPRAASAAAKLAMSWGVLSALAYQRGLPIVQASPQQIKHDVAGDKRASKDTLAAALLDVYGCEATARYLDEVPASRREHGWDALGAVVACETSDVVKLARSMGRGAA